MTVGRALRWTQGALFPSPDAQSDARLFVAYLLDCAPSKLLRMSSQTLEARQESALRAFVDRRRAGEPTQYILGEAWFMGLPFQVDGRVLIPRQDTETLCEAALCAARETGAATALDLCTGSGALAVALAILGGLKVTATDISPDALAVARRNAARSQADVSFYEGDLFAALPAGAAFPLIVCNPPYLTGADMSARQREVLCEPELALYGGDDGLAFYRRLAREAPSYLKPGGRLLMEVGAGQAPDVAALMSWGQTRALSDLRGVDRVVEARARG